MSDCYINSKVRLRRRDERAFMGRTHALSAVAVFMAFAAFMPQVTEWMTGSKNVAVILMAAAVVAGASLIPDLDNSSSTARNSLGPLGVILSGVVRSVSVVIQTTIRTSKDEAEANPHRGAAHTIPGAMAFGLGVFLLTAIPGSVDLPKIGVVSTGDLMAILVTTLLLHLAMEALAKELLDGLDNLLIGELAQVILALGITLAIFSQIPENTSYWWLGASVFVGAVVHIIGDCFTTMGCPLYFPIPRKGKLWWKVRFTSMKAGGMVENAIMAPVFSLVILASAASLFGIF